MCFLKRCPSVTSREPRAHFASTALEAERSRHEQSSRLILQDLGLASECVISLLYILDTDHFSIYQNNIPHSS